MLSATGSPPRSSVLDLRIWVLTHPASVWDAASIETDCLNAFAGQDISVAVKVFSNPQGEDQPLSPLKYLASALVAQWRVGGARLAGNFSVLSLWWHIRQLGGLLASLGRLVSPNHIRRVRVESLRAFRIAKGHSLMWQCALNESAKLHLLLEDDVFLSSPDELVRLTKSFLNNKSLPSKFICDCSHSYTLSEIGIDPKGSIGNQSAAEFESYKFPFTNTLAASFVSPELLNLSATASLDGRVGRGLGIDLDLMQLWSRREFNVVGCSSANPVFQQQSGFRNQKI